jgi:hypothetical protein
MTTPRFSWRLLARFNASMASAALSCGPQLAQKKLLRDSAGSGFKLKHVVFEKKWFGAWPSPKVAPPPRPRFSSSSPLNFATPATAAHPNPKPLSDRQLLPPTTITQFTSIEVKGIEKCRGKPPSLVICPWCDSSPVPKVRRVAASCELSIIY